MPVEIHGNNYKTVAERLAEFREEHPDYSISSEIVSIDGDNVVIKASIHNGDQLVSTGLAHESKADGYINATSYVENCETSAVGRCLAFFKYAGTEIRSADEMQQATNQQEASRLISNSHAIADNAFTVFTIKHGIECEMLADAAESWFTLSDEDKKGLWVARSKGGAFTAKERETIQSSEFRKAFYVEDSKADAYPY